MFKGSIVALVTPFRNGDVDYEKLKELVEFHIKHGTDGIVPVGTTGESPTLSHGEHEKVIATVTEAAGGRVPVIAGAGSNNTTEAISLTKFSKSVGADATLQVTPYYNKPTQAGLVAHFRKIADDVDLPIVLYNIPGRSVISMTPETIAELAGHPNIVAVKEATGSLAQASSILNLCDITILSGDDALTLPLMSVGAKGVISVVANVVPARMAELARKVLEGDFTGAREIHDELWLLFKMSMIESNPIPVKAMMKCMGMITGELRLPLVPLLEKNEKTMLEVMRKLGLLDK
ncbi:MAG: 4-hydroxy-tetrahydrodipicolinate synthase [Planctomycetota bacterium]|nr:MAG: 4-hydroxy-tetrahydrodipicolinate synthase [Planctomycetota bacterium]